MMTEPTLVPETRSNLSAVDRLTLIQTLNALPLAQFDELVFALGPPKGNIPGESAPQSSRSKALLEWAESPIGSGLEKLEELLGSAIATRSRTAEYFVGFVISGKINRSTMAEIQAYVQLLRKKTGDNSIDVAFFKEGSIKIILSGSLEGLEKLQELFSSGELEDIETAQVEDINRIDNDTTDARKARLSQVLRLHKRFILTSISTILDRTYNRRLVRDLTLSSTLALARDLTRDLARASTLALALADTRDLTRAYNLARASTLALASALASTLALASALASTNDLARTSVASDLILASDLARDLVRDLARDLARATDLDLKEADLKGTNLKDINLSGTDLTGADLARANLSNADLTEANLTDTNLADANVTETIFGNNLGLTESDKLNLKRRGAIFQDPPTSDVPSLVLR